MLSKNDSERRWLQFSYLRRKIRYNSMVIIETRI